MIQISKEDRSLIVKINCDIDHHTVTLMKRKIDDSYSQMCARNIVFNFENVTFMDSSGIGMIIGRYKNVHKQGGQVFVANINKDLDRIFDISGLPKIVPVFSSVPEALDALHVKN